MLQSACSEHWLPCFIEIHICNANSADLANEIHQHLIWIYTVCQMSHFCDTGHKLVNCTAFHCHPFPFMSCYDLINIESDVKPEIIKVDKFFALRVGPLEKGLG